MCFRLYKSRYERESGYEIVHVRFLFSISFCTVSAGIYVLSYLVDDMMSNPSNIISLGGHLCTKNINLGLVLSSSSSSFSSLSLQGGAGRAGAGHRGGVQWLLCRTARPVCSDF